MEWQQGQSGKAPRLVVLCPECGQELIVRINHKTGERFLGCSGYPERCRYTQPLSEYHQKLLRGDPRLPGF